MLKINSSEGAIITKLVPIILISYKMQFSTRHFQETAEFQQVGDIENKATATCRRIAPTGCTATITRIDVFVSREQSRTEKEVYSATIMLIGRM